LTADWGVAIVLWLWVLLTVASLLVAFHCYVVVKYLKHIVYVFQVRPLFKIPQGQPLDDAERISFKTADGLTLHGCYLRGVGPRKGVILFGPEFGSNCWSCIPYCGFLLNHGYDLCSFEVRGQGDSEIQPGYEPLQWATNYEVLDFQSALAYLKNRADADPAGVGFFGISKGGSAGLIVAAADPYVRCCVTDGIFATAETMVPYMRKWVTLYSGRRGTLISRFVPDWYFRIIARVALNKLCEARQCSFPHLEDVIGKVAPRPLLMIHGGADTYIKPEMARSLYRRARAPKEFWLVDKAKHNQSIQIANGAYQQRVLDFFEKNLKTTVVSAPLSVVGSGQP